MEYLKYFHIGRIVLFSLFTAVVFCSVFHLGRAENESESSFESASIDDAEGNSEPAAEPTKMHEASSFEMFPAPSDDNLSHVKKAELHEEAKRCIKRQMQEQVGDIPSQLPEMRFDDC